MGRDRHRWYQVLTPNARHTPSSALERCVLGHTRCMHGHGEVARLQFVTPGPDEVACPLYVIAELGDCLRPSSQLRAVWVSVCSSPCIRVRHTVVAVLAKLDWLVMNRAEGRQLQKRVVMAEAVDAIASSDCVG